MPDDAQPNSVLVAKIGSLPPERVAEVEAFVDALRDQDIDCAMVKAAQAASQTSFATAWENSDDAIYDGL